MCVGGPNTKLGFFVDADDEAVTDVSRLSGVTFGVGMDSSFFGVAEAFFGVDPVDPRTRWSRFDENQRHCEV